MPPPRWILLICTSLLAGFSPLKSEKGPPTSEEVALAYYHASRADALYESPNVSLYHAEKAISVFSRGGLAKQEVRVRNGLNYVYYKGLKDTVAYERNNFRAYEVAMSELPPDDQDRITAINNHALVFSRLRMDYHTSLDILERGYANITPAVDPNVRGGMLYNIGNHYFRIGDFLSAAKYYALSADILRLEEERLKPKLIDAHTENGRALAAARRYSVAIKVLEEGCRLGGDSSQAHSPTLKSKLQRCRLYLAESYRLAGRDTTAKEVLGQLLLETDISTENRAAALTELIKLYLDREEGEAATQRLEELRGYPNANAIVSASRFHLEARAAHLLGRKNEALVSLGKAVECLGGEMGVEAETEKSASVYLLVRLLRDKADWTAADTLSTEAQMSALRIYKRISQLSDYLRDQYQTKEAQLLLLDRRQGSFEAALGVLFRLWNRRPEAWILEEALYYVEKSKNTLLLDELRQRSMNGGGKGASDDFDREYRLRKEIAYLRRLTTTQVAAQEKDSSRYRLLTAERKWRSWKDSLSIKYPVYRQLTQLPLPSVKVVRDSLAGEGAIVLNFLSTNTWIYSLRIGSDVGDFRRIAHSQLGENFSVRFIESLRLRDATEIEQFNREGWRLQQLLVNVESLPSNVKRLIILPDGELAILPFSCMLTDKSEAEPGNLPYLIKAYDVENGYSAAVLLLQERRPLGESGKLLGFYPVYRGLPLYQKSVDRRFNDFRIYRGKHLRDEAASRTTFLSSRGMYSVLLFAGHATSVGSQGDEPGLIFYDTTLLLSDLAGGQLSVDLAILSACETNVGRLQPGEGMMSMARGFAYAGVNSMITTLWLVAEDATLHLVSETLDEITVGRPVARGLNQAQRNYLARTDIPYAEKAPYYWAGIISLGANRSVKIIRYSGYEWLWWLLLPAGGGLLYYYRRKGI